MSVKMYCPCQSCVHCSLQLIFFVVILSQESDSLTQRQITKQFTAFTVISICIIWFQAECPGGCRNGGFCNERHVCECPDGFYGPHCEKGNQNGFFNNVVHLIYIARPAKLSLLFKILFFGNGQMWLGCFQKSNLKA